MAQSSYINLMKNKTRIIMINEQLKKGEKQCNEIAQWLCPLGKQCYLKFKESFVAFSRKKMRENDNI
jgi:hypothetical protein